MHPRSLLAQLDWGPSGHWFSQVGFPSEESSSTQAQARQGFRLTGRRAMRQRGAAREFLVQSQPAPEPVFFSGNTAPLDPEQKREDGRGRDHSAKRTLSILTARETSQTPGSRRSLVLQPDSGDGKLGFAHDDTLFDAYSRQTMLHT